MYVIQNFEVRLYEKSYRKYGFLCIFRQSLKVNTLKLLKALNLFYGVST